jgi:hypothetical protein
MNQHRDQRVGLTDVARSPFGASNRLADSVLTLVIVELTIATAYIHLRLGAVLYTLNGLGYLGLATAYVAAAAIPILRPFGWLARIGLAAYAALTIGAYLAVGPYFDLGWITKGIELAIVGLVFVDLVSTHGGLGGLWRAAIGFLRPSRVAKD